MGKYIAYKTSKIFRWPEMCPLRKILAQDFQIAALTKILGRRDKSIVPLLHGKVFFCFRSKRVDRCGVEHEEYLEAVDLTSCVGTIPTWLASYFLV